MQKKTTFILLALGVTFTLSASACSYHKGKGHHGRSAHMEKRFFERLDDNENTFIELEEHQEMVNHIFEKLDDNEDNIISQDERPKKRHGKKGKMFLLHMDGEGDISKEDALKHVAKQHKDADANNDGKLSFEELSSHRKTKRFNALDANDDGAISKEEFLNHYQKKEVKAAE